jgi:hypothetical protein
LEATSLVGRCLAAPATAPLPAADVCRLLSLYTSAATAHTLPLTPIQHPTLIQRLIASESSSLLLQRAAYWLLPTAAHFRVSTGRVTLSSVDMLSA